MAFWPGLGFNDLQAGPKANGSQAKARPGQTKAKPKSHGFLASGQSQAVTTRPSRPSYHSGMPALAAASKIRPIFLTILRPPRACRRRWNIGCRPWARSCLASIPSISTLGAHIIDIGTSSSSAAELFVSFPSSVTHEFVACKT